MITNISGASTSIISPAFFEEWVLPELVWLVERVGERKYIGFHSTGKMREILPIMIGARPHFVLRFESPRFGGDISLEEAKQRFGDRTCLMGGYDPHIYTLGVQEEIRVETIRCLHEAAEGGRYILAHSDAIPQGARMEDVRLSAEIAEEFGKYKH
jgi:uroporphyrinogen decarboxylase